MHSPCVLSPPSIHLQKAAHLPNLELCSLNNHCPSSFSPAPANTSPLSVSMNLTFLSTSCKWNHIVFVLLWLAYFIWHSVFKVHPCWSMCQNFLFLKRMSNIALYVYVCSSLNYVWLFVTLWTVVHQVPLSMEFSRQEYWSELPCPSPGDLLDWTWVSCLAGRFFTIWATRKAFVCIYHIVMTNLDSILKSRHYFANKGLSSQSCGFSSSYVRMWEWTIKKAECQRIELLNCDVGEDSWESLGLQGDPTSPS